MLKSHIFFSILLLVACGTEPAKDAAEAGQTAGKDAAEAGQAAESAVVPSVDKQDNRGEKGDKGDVGPVGPMGPRGEAGKPVSGNEWYDPITDCAWLIGPSVSAAAVDANACGKGWKLPNNAEAMAAVQHGLSIESRVLGGAPDVWTTEFRGIYRQAISSSAALIDSSGLFRASGGIFCLKE